MPELLPVATSHSLISSGRPAETKVLPSGVKAIARTPSGLNPFQVTRVALLLPLATSNSLIAPRHTPPEARVLPSGLNTTTVSGHCFRSSRRTLPLRVATSHSLTLLNQPPVASTLPSGPNATQPHRYGSFSFRVVVFRPVATSHNLIEWSSLPEARVLPSGLKHRDLTASVCPSKVTCGLRSWPDRGSDKTRHAATRPRFPAALSVRSPCFIPALVAKRP